MRFKLDENLHSYVADWLRQAGHDAMTVYDQGLRGKDDAVIIEHCRVEGRVLMSLDLDFSNILMFPPEKYPGLIVFRLRKVGRSAVLKVVEQLMPHLLTTPVSERLWVVDEHRIRIHGVGDLGLDTDAP